MRKGQNGIYAKKMDFQGFCDAYWRYCQSRADKMDKNNDYTVKRSAEELGISTVTLVNRIKYYQRTGKVKKIWFNDGDYGNDMSVFE